MSARREWIEPIPKNIIKARLNENGYKPVFGRYQSVRFIRTRAPIMPEYQSTELFFNKTRPWWTHVANEDYVPLKLVMVMLDTKEDKWEEDANNYSVAIAELARRTRERYNLHPKSMKPKQKSAFVEEVFAKSLFAEVMRSNRDHDGKVNKLSFELKEEVSNIELELEWKWLTERLAVMYGSAESQRFLIRNLR